MDAQSTQKTQEENKLKWQENKFILQWQQVLLTVFKAA